MRILLCNDDGYQAQGIQTLARHLRAHSHEVFIVAPSEERSGQSHAMTFFRPLLSRRIDSSTWSVHGTPADSAAIGLQHFMQGQPPDLVVSGINHGLNVGIDINYSGTVGAATEACLLGYRAMAVSVDLQRGQSPKAIQNAFDLAAQLTLDVIGSLADLEWSPREILNLNHPGVPAKGVVQALSGGYSLWVPQVAPCVLENGFPEMEVFMLGGRSRTNNGDLSQDVTRVQEGYATLSFLLARQSSVGANASLDRLIARLD